MSKLSIGDILEIPTSKGLAYAQYTHQHPQFGGLIRIFDTLAKTRASNLTELVSSSVRFSTFFPVAAAVKRGLVSIVGRHEVTRENKSFPLFRDGVADPKTKKVAVWWLWDGEKEWKIGTLTPEQRKLPIREVLNVSMLIKLIEDGWTPSSDPT